MGTETLLAVGAVAMVALYFAALWWDAEQKLRAQKERLAVTTSSLRSISGEIEIVHSNLPTLHGGQIAGIGSRLGAVANYLDRE